jgi:uncharacterized protein YjbJ (UPF0337 family)
MGLDDKLKNKTQEVTGSAKEKVGDWTGDESMEAEGKKDKAVGNIKEAGEKVKDAFN